METKKIKQFNFYDEPHYKIRKVDLDRVEISKKWDLTAEEAEEEEPEQGCCGKASRLVFRRCSKCYQYILNCFTRGGKGQESSGNTIVIYEDVKVYDWAHKAFHKLRYEDGITPENIIESLDPDENEKSALQAGESAGKSGSFFIFSKDKKFIIKTIFQEEMDTFISDLPKYFKHLENNPESLLARIYGLFQVQMKGIVPVNFILMASTIKCRKGGRPIKIFDLKGSMINRYVDKKEDKGKKSAPTLKDKNLLACKQRRSISTTKEGYLQFQKSDQMKLKDLCKKDTGFFEKKYLDYSILLAIEKKSKRKPLDKESIPKAD